MHNAAWGLAGIGQSFLALAAGGSSFLPSDLWLFRGAHHIGKLGRLDPIICVRALLVYPTT
ncbi:hypothetical protein P691DRAFT_801174 [Macrolepiota fuliginosa MF-IS2]|uniref:Uncharacterized protein n=1 Tax=Macrolepiota fuliginosa MF-IS2 TaxID=1400762 RepID=A0A9P6C9Q1_9AGAR|nr:hypothetical protein P691DRAFT_801174 [Macrolepiota fuliginosa MF-IS2]